MDKAQTASDSEWFSGLRHLSANQKCTVFRELDLFPYCGEKDVETPKQVRP
jgi:hypothetical protein